MRYWAHKHLLAQIWPWKIGQGHRNLISSSSCPMLYSWQSHWKKDTYFYFWWQNWVHYSTHAYIIPWYVAKHVWVDAKSVIASESQKWVKGQLSAKYHLLCYRYRVTLFYQFNHDKNLPILHKSTWSTSLISFEFTKLSIPGIYLGQRSFKIHKIRKYCIPCIYI